MIPWTFRWCLRWNPGEEVVDLAPHPTQACEGLGAPAPGIYRCFSHELLKSTQEESRQLEFSWVICGN